MGLNPLETTEKVVGKYIDYLTTTFSLNDPDLQQQLIKKFQQKNKFSRGPILEATPPFQKGCTLIDLIEERILSKEFYQLNVSEELPLDRTLYLHQEKAIRKVIDQDRNLVVATGTGSGKTETFLIPILNHLFKQKEKGILNPGVRALLLYPMNALANDQLKRLRSLLKNYPAVTFGSYTGETKEKYTKALDRYHKMNNGKFPLKNELISREQMKAEPPHILITNYAMLEYLMLRPKDHTFFDGEYARSWKYIVLDEAHTYTGAKAIEMSMLLRRLKARVSDAENRLKCIATSATIGSGTQDFPEVAEFASKLFAESFVYEKSDPDKQDIIQAYRQNLNIKQFEDTWGSPNPSLYLRWKDIIENENKAEIVLNSLKNAAQNANIPQSVLQKADSQINSSDWRKYIYIILKGDKKLIRLQKSLRKNPQLLSKIANKIFSRQKDYLQYLIALVYLANKARWENRGAPLLPARYHLFIRAIEGAYLSFLPEKKLFLERKEKHKCQGKEYPVFEIGTCRQCNALYLLGNIAEKEDGDYLLQPGHEYYKNQGNLSYFLVLEQNTAKVTDNEDEIIEMEKNNQSGVKFSLCPECGNIKTSNSLFSGCDCESEPIKLIKVKDKQGQVHKCPACGTVRSIGSIVWRFLLGGDAITSVLATSLYQQLPGKIKLENNNKNTEPGWGNEVAAVKEEDELESDGNGKQLLIFSDSRQDAAFFATYLNKTYQQIIRRQLILKMIQENQEKVIKNQWRVRDLASGLKSYLSRKQIYPGKSLQEIEDLAWKWVLYEFLILDRKNSLESLGLLGFSLLKPEYFVAGPLQKYGLNEQESWDLFQVLLHSFRKYGAISFPENISPEDSFFEPRNREYYFKENSSEYNIYSWNPSRKGILNSRLDFLLRLSKYGLDKNLSREDCLKLLNDIWRNGLNIGSRNSMFRGYFSTVHNRTKGQMCRMNLDYWKLNPSIVDSSVKWYYCPVCNRITLYNVKGICPTYRCSGRLEPCAPKELFSNNHYRNLYLDNLPVEMKSREHTAQLTTEAAADIQSKFNAGKVNVLSCSTTFELGVDVGELESVFMRNVPPSAANYIQRAGRAGRRTDSTAFALTFARRKSHDLTYFQNSLAMVSGKINPPHFKIKNDKIIERHIYASALAFFWRENPKYFGNANDFFFTAGISRFYQYLSKKPDDLQNFLTRITPESSKLDLQNWNWINNLIGEKGVMELANIELKNDIRQLEKVQDKLVEKKKFGKANVIKRVIRTLKSKYLINYMSQNDIIPKYGFPVDVINLKIDHHGDEAKNLDLNRDMKIALSEYAPGSQVIAGGKLWISRYLKTLPDKDLIKRKYAICENCGNYHSEIAETNKQLEVCQVCGEPFGRRKGIFVTPEFGFISVKPEEPKMRRPKKTYTSRQYFTGEYKKSSASVKKLDLNGINVELISANRGKLAVINNAGFKRFSICQSCGYAEINNNEPGKTHKTPWGQDCNGKRNILSLGYEFYTDILQVRFKDSYFGQEQKGYWESILYGMLEGISQALGIERRDIDGCLYPYTGDPLNPALVFYDSVPGGAGHVERIVLGDNFQRVLKKTGDIVNRCECGGREGDTSCYGCLRNYNNEYCHDILKRKYVMNFIKLVLK